MNKNLNTELNLLNNRFITPVNLKETYKHRQENFKKYIESKNKEKKIQKKIDVIKNETSTKDYQQSKDFNFNTDLKQLNNRFKKEKKSIVVLDSRNRDTILYPKQNSFKIFLGKTFYNVKKIRLVSTEFPNTDQVITNLPVELQNNIISWENIEDFDLNYFTNVLIDTIEPHTVDITIQEHGLTIGSSLDIIIYNSKLDSESVISGIIDGEKRANIIDENTLRILFDGGIPIQGTCNVNLGYPKYTNEIKPGNYTASTLTERASLDLSKIKRRNKQGQLHYFSVSVNLDTDVILFDSVITTQLPNNSLSTTSGSTTITVNQNGHGFKTGDRVKMIGVKNLSGITGSLLNGDFEVNVLDFNTFTYETTIRANETKDGGGNTIQTGKDAPFRLLFNTDNTRIQFNIGFPDENSTDPINSVDPITTKSLEVLDITKISSTKLRITTSINHELDTCNIISISNISTGNTPKITTSTEHGISLPQRVLIRNTNSSPRINGTFYVIPSGPFTFNLVGKGISIAGTTGEILYGGDQIKIFNLRCVPNINSVSSGIFFVENIPFPNQFDISFMVDTIDTNSVAETIIGTSQVIVNHPSHGFNNITSITNTAINFASIGTFIPHNFFGYRQNNIDIVDGPSTTNTVDINLANHRLSTSDTVIIKNSTTIPIVDGTYKIQVVSLDTIRINFVHSTFTAGQGTVIVGDRIPLTKTNSLPRIDGIYNIHNRLVITDITTGTLTSTITTDVPHNWVVGDIVSITETNSTPDINGNHTIQTILSTTSFEIDLINSVVSPGNFGIIVNKTRFEIETGVILTSPGINPAGIIMRDHKVIHYRIEPKINSENHIGGLPLSILNGTERPISKLINVDNYLLRVEDFANETVIGGGENVRVSSRIHGFRSIQANTFSGTSEGTLYRSISLEGQNYLYLVCPGLDTVLNSSNIPNVFAKILLSESPGLMIFNSFVSTEKEFDYPIPKLDTLDLKILTPEGYLFNLNDINYALSLEITELADYLENTYVSSQTGSSERLQEENKNNGGFKNQGSGSKSGSLDVGAGNVLGGILRAEGGRGASIAT